MDAIHPVTTQSHRTSGSTSPARAPGISGQVHLENAAVGAACVDCRQHEEHSDVRWASRLRQKTDGDGGSSHHVHRFGADTVLDKVQQEKGPDGWDEPTTPTCDSWMILLGIIISTKTSR